MKVYVLTAVNSFGGDVYFASTHRTFEGAKEEMMLRFKSPVRKGRSYKRDLRTIGFRSFFYR